MNRTTAATHADAVFRAIETGEAARSPLVASWHRSNRKHGLDPAMGAPPRRSTEAEIARARSRMGALLHIAQPNLDRLFNAVCSAGCSVLLADQDGLVVERRGLPGDDDTFRKWGLWTGALWSETYEGTNGIGTCLVEQRTLTIDRDQHFLTRNGLMSCTTAPIFDEHGALVAALDVSSCRTDVTEGFVDLIAMALTDAARRIEAENFRQAFSDARIMLVSAPERQGPALVAVDQDDLLVGATRAARLSLGISAETLAYPVPVADLIAGSATQDGLDRAERASLHRAIARARGNMSEAARSLGISRATLYRKMLELGLRKTG